MKMSLCFFGIVSLPVMAMLQVSGMVNWQCHIDQVCNMVYTALSALQQNARSQYCDLTISTDTGCVCLLLGHNFNAIVWVQLHPER